MSRGTPDGTAGCNAVLAISVLHAHAAYDYEHVAARVLDPELLADAVAIRVFRVPLLAVPVGARRRAGSLTVDHQAVGAAVASVLTHLRGFPNVRLTQVPGQRGGYAVEWGEPLPADWPDEARSLFYGLRDARRPDGFHPVQDPACSSAGTWPSRASPRSR